MGEIKANIYIIGSPEVDIMIGNNLPPQIKVKKLCLFGLTPNELPMRLRLAVSGETI